MKVLITGAGGQVGQALIKSAPPAVSILGLTHAQLDISDAVATRTAVARFAPALVINAAAYTAVDKAEAEPERAAAINVEGVRNLANAVRPILSCRMLHISTDYVFDGQAEAAYKPTDATNPLSVYGRTKRQGEEALLEVLGDRAVVLRTAWVYDARSRNFLSTMLRLMAASGKVRVVSDQHGTPTTADSIAEALWAVAATPKTSRILHWTDGGKTTWYEFAVAIAEEARAARLLDREVEVTPISTAEYPTAAHRPANSTLDCSEALYQLRLPATPWRDNLRATLAQRH